MNPHRPMSQARRKTERRKEKTRNELKRSGSNRTKPVEPSHSPLTYTIDNQARNKTPYLSFMHLPLSLHPSRSHISSTFSAARHLIPHPPTRPTILYFTKATQGLPRVLHHRLSFPASMFQGLAIGSKGLALRGGEGGGVIWDMN